MSPPRKDWRARQVLVTGGTGFIGGRLIEKLFLECGAEKVRALVRDFSHTPRIARFPVEMSSASLQDAGALERAVAECSVIFHCAHETRHPESARINQEAIQNIARAAARHKAHLVYVSSAGVYGDAYFSPVKQRVLEEDAPKEAIHVNVSSLRSKLDAERSLAHARKAEGLDYVVLQPGLVYGPYCADWVIRPLAEMKTGPVAVLDRGAGQSNFVYVDDLVDLMLVAAIEPTVSGETFLVSAATPSTWREVYDHYERMAGTGRVLYVSEGELKRLRRSQAKRAAKDLFRALADQSIIRKAEQIPGVLRSFDLARHRLPKVIGSITSLRSGQNAHVATAAAAQPAIAGPSTVPSKAAVDDRAIHLPDELHVALQQTKTAIAPYKAIQRLGYQPRFDLDSGMALVEDFARWANLL